LKSFRWNLSIQPTPVFNPPSEINNEGSAEESMCPACMAGAALMAGSVMSTGGIAALAVKIVRGKKSGEEDNSKNITKNDAKEK